MRESAALVVMLSLLPPAAAQDEPPPALLRLGLDQAVERALAASPRLHRLRALEDASAAETRGARAARLPQLDLGAGYTRTSDVPELTLAVPGAPPRTIFPNIPDNYRTRLSLWLPLYTGGRLSRLVDAAAEERLATGRDVQAERAELVFETHAAYWSLVTARESVRVLAEALVGYEAHLTDARNRERFGTAARNEVLAVQVERDRAELSRLEAESAVEVAQAQLARLLGLAAGARVDPSEPVESPPAPRGDLEALVASALGTRPERAALQSRLAAAEARLRAERAARAPQVSGAAGYDYANPNRRILPPEAAWNDTWDVSLNLSLSLFDGGRTSAAIARAAARVEAARAQLQELDRQVRLQVTRALLELGTAEAGIEVSARGLESARESRKVAADRYREGLIPSSELLDAEVALLRAGLDRTEALVRVRLARAALARATGR